MLNEKRECNFHFIKIKPKMAFIQFILCPTKPKQLQMQPHCNSGIDEAKEQQYGTILLLQVFTAGEFTFYNTMHAASD